jgi:hypothetical protein
MIKHNQDGAVSAVTVSLILAVILLIAALGVAAWAITGRQDYKDHSDRKVAAAVAVAKQKESTAKDKQFAEDIKNPLKTYDGPEAYGSLKLSFPKTWSGYVSVAGSGGNALVDGFFAPGVVPSATDQNSVFALRVQVVNTTYDQSLQSYASQQQAGKLTATAYALPKLPKIVGVKLTGQITEQKTVTMIVLPLRSQTLQIWTEGTQYLNDFNTYILPNFSFSP